MTQLKIGELAARVGVTVQTVRFYERKGLLAPPNRSEGGFRMYDADVVGRLRFIRDGQDLGFTLAEILELLNLRSSDETSCEQVRAVAQKRLDAIESKIEQLENMRAILSRLANLCATETQDDCPVLSFIESPSIA